MEKLVIYKRCSRCYNPYPRETGFRNQTNTKDGKKYYCIECDDIIQKERYKKRRQSHIDGVRRWQAENSEKVKEINGRYRKTQAEKLDFRRDDSNIDFEAELEENKELRDDINEIDF